MLRVLLGGLLLLSGSVFAQGPRSNGFGSFSGFGSVAFPGLGHPPNVSRYPSTAAYTAATHGYNRPAYNGRGYGYRRPLVAAYPVFIGGYGGYGGYDDSGYYDSYGGYSGGAPPAQPNVTIVNTPPPAAAPPVVINQYFGGPPPAQADDQGNQSVRFYQPQLQQGAESAVAGPDARTYLIAYKDHSVYTALAYWVEDHTLHYVTTQNTHNQADLSLIDIDFTKKLNSDRSLPFSVASPQ